MRQVPALGCGNIVPSYLCATNRRAAAYLMRAQESSGDWPQQHISGVFNRNCMITYANYR
jgi:squalene cyclase